MPSIIIYLFFILVLIAANGVFTMSELAVVSARKARLKQLADRGDKGARTALGLANDPNRLLSTAQIGITLVGTLAGVFGGATIAEEVAGRLGRVPALAPYAGTLSLIVVVVGIAYCSLVFGELVPRRLAMGNPDRIATTVAAPLRLLSLLVVPAVKVLNASTEVVLRPFGIRSGGGPPVTEEEVKALVEEGTQAGVFDQAEHEMVKRVFRLGDRRAAALMTPSTEVAWVDVADPTEEVRRKVTESPHSQFPVCDGTLDNVLGIVRVKDLLVRGAAGRTFDLKGLLTVPLLIYEGMPGLKVLEVFKQSGTHVALVLDEYGSVRGLLTMNDILEALVGDMPTGDGVGDRKAVRREDGSWLLDGMLTTDEFRDIFEGVPLPEGGYETLAGLVMTRLNRIPSVADHFEWGGLRFEVVDMDGNRVDKVLVAPRDPGPRPT
jgi:putative hemolysin